MGWERLLFAALAAAACGDDPAAVIDAAANIDGAGHDGALAIDAALATCEPTAGTDLILEPAASGLVRPVFVTAPPGDPRLFVVEQAGRIRIADGDQLETFLDIQDRVLDEGSEQGLLGLAFHPDFASNGRFFVYYTATADPFLDVVAEYDTGDLGVERRVLEVDDPHQNHNGGMIAFGPDRNLYIGLGDGGGPADPGNNGQDRTTLLGDMLRIDVDGERPYGIPDDNPFADSPGGERPEIWLSGLRNPWRWSFDRDTGELYIGDVGAGSVEEISLVPAGQGGLNLGWDDMEGDACYDDPDCAPSDFHGPIATYPNPPEGPPCRAVIGGYVYRGACFPDLQGWYFYGDFCTNQVFTLEAEGGVLVAGPTEVTADLDPDAALLGLSSFGQDAAGELYAVSRQDGRIFRIAAQP